MKRILSLITGTVKRSGFRGLLAALVFALAAIASSAPVRAELSGEMQGAITAMVNSAIAGEDADGLSAAINDLCAAHPDIKEEIVAAVASELAGKRPPGFCAGKAGPCLDLDSIMDTLLANVLAPYETASERSLDSGQSAFLPENNTAECGGGDCSVEPPPSVASSPASR